MEGERMTPGLIEIVLDYTVIQRPDFDTIALAHDMRAARDRCGLTIGEVADRVGVPRTEAEHWFRTDTYNSPPDPDIWATVRSILGISGWDIVGESYTTPNIHEM